PVFYWIGCKSDDVFIRAQGANSEGPGHRGGSAKRRPHPTSRRASEALEKNVACSIHVSIDDGGALVAVECLGCPKVSLDEPAVGAGLAGVLFTDHPDNGAILLCLALHSVHESTVGQLDHALSVALADVSEAMAVESWDQDDVVFGAEGQWSSRDWMGIWTRGALFRTRWCIAYTVGGRNCKHEVLGSILVMRGAPTPTQPSRGYAIMVGH
ncbi:uncharacterized protein BJ171DRAFT_146211, partial [Polychytrium aggregatum]|uniref:uncharacterized protein n=1 Tax=Polychytrium aggregatum TaxID=110093 RepID=UPI0022FDD50D